VADEVRKLTATIPAGTPIAAPVTVDVSFPPRTVRTIDWRIPPGAAGVMGWRLSMGGVQVIPTESDPWVIDDGNSGTFVVDGYPDSGAWQVTGYNTGAFPHSVYLVFHLDLVKAPAPQRSLIDPVLLLPLPDWTVLRGPRGGG
jgi:hypothetical protein